MGYINGWLEEERPSEAAVWLLTEREGERVHAFHALCASVKNHLIGDDILARLEFPRAAAAVRNRLPTEKRIRSGDLGEIIATDYVIHKAEFTVPLLRLRYKDDRNMSMRGDDIIALDMNATPVRMLKAEVKSRAELAAAVVAEACVALANNGGRGKPSSLSFISMQLRREGNDALALVLESLQETDVHPERIVHLVFTFSGNPPVSYFADQAAEEVAVSERRLVGLRVADHQQLIAQVFAALDA